ncbi:MAG: DUF2807 domain-containing protein, partial [Acidobacteriota bacterium]
MEVELDGNLIKYLRTEERNGRLVVEFTRWIVDYTEFNIRITVPDLSGILLSGAGNMVISNEFVTESIQFDLAGTGNIRANITATTVTNF